MQLKSKKEAAELLGVSTRAIERAVRRGHLAAQYRPSKHGRMAWFAAADLDRYRNFQQVRAPLGFTSDIDLPKREPGIMVGTITPLDESLARQRRENSVPLHQRLMLSVEEAVELSGLPRNFVLEKIQSKQLKAVKIGRSLMLKRRDLEDFVEKL